MVTKRIRPDAFIFVSVYNAIYMKLKTGFQTKRNEYYTKNIRPDVSCYVNLFYLFFQQTVHSIHL